MSEFLRNSTISLTNSSSSRSNGFNSLSNGNLSSNQDNKSEEILPANPIEKVPYIALGLHDLLLSCGISNYEPRIIEQLLEVSHRYTSDVVSEAKIFQKQTQAKQVESFHVNLAVQAIINHTITKPSNVDALLDLAKECNESGFQISSNSKHQVLLPPERHCLVKVNYGFSKNKKPRLE